MSVPSRRRRFRFLPHTTRGAAGVAIGVVLALSLLDLIGWLFNVPLLKSVSPQWIPMKAVTAVSFIFLATAMALILKGGREEGRKEGRKEGSGGGRLLAVRILASLAILVGVLTVLDYVIDMANGRGNPMYGIPFVHAFLTSDARMALLTALLLMFFGSATLLLASGRARAAGVAHALVFPAAVVSYFVPTSYLLGVQSLHDWLGTPVALNSGVAFCALGATVFLARRDTWLMRVFTGEHGGSAMARRLLPGLMVLPLVVGWLRLYGERTAFYKSEVGVALVALTYTVCFVWLVWFAARSTNRTDEQRRKAERAVADSERALRRLNAELEQRVRDATAEVRQANEVLEQRVAERAGELQKANEFLLASRRAALNLTEDAVEARKSAEQAARELALQNVELRNTEESLRATTEYLEKLMANANAPIIVWDPQFRITRFNHAFERLTGLRVQDVVGKGIELLFPPNRREELMALIRGASGGERWEVVEIPIQHAAGEVRTVLWNSALLFDSDGKTPVATIAQGQDITGRVRAEQALARNEDEYRRFTQMLAHSIKSPLSTVRLLAQGLESNPAADSARPVILEQVERLNRIALSLMYLSDSRTMQRTAVDLNRLVRRTMVEQSLEMQTGVKLDLNLAEELPPVKANEEQFVRILGNLVDNALGAMEGKGVLTVVTRADGLSDVVVVEVGDTGPGIPEAFREKLFQPFLTRKPGGTGLGLSIVKRIVEDHGGTVELVSKPDEGARFRLTLPVQA